MLQKLENTYLSILRFVVIFVAGLLLIGVVILGVNSLKLLQSPPEFENKAPSVNKEDIIIDITRKDQEPEPNKEVYNPVGKKKDDPNLAAYQKTADEIAEFVEKNSKGQQQVNKEKVIQIIKNRAESQPGSLLTEEFATQLSSTVKDILKDKKVIESAASSSSPVYIINDLLNSFEKEFNNQRQMMRDNFNSEKAEYAQSQVDALQSLYVAAGAFGAFLLIVFLSIFIKIERNLRSIATQKSLVDQ